MMTLEELYQAGRKVVTGSLTFTAETSSASPAISTRNLPRR